MRKAREITWLAVSALAIVVLLPEVADAYMIQLAQLPAGTTVPFGGSGMSNVTRQRLDGSNAAVPLSVSFVSRMSQSALTTPTRALWSMYPAAVRGRAFGGTGSDPLMGGRAGSGW